MSSGTEASADCSTLADRPSAPWAYLLLLIVVALTHGRIVNQRFVRYDDSAVIFGNPVLSTIDQAAFIKPWREPVVELYSPIYLNVLAIEAWWAQRDAPQYDHSRLDPRVFHVVSLLLHAATSSVVLSLLRRLVGSTGPALVGAILFAVHPMQVETVAWATETKGLLAGLGVFGSIRLFLAFSDRWESNGRARAIALYLAASVIQAAALLSKPSAVVTPLLVLLLEVGWLGRSWKRAILALFPWCLMGLGVALMTRVAQSEEMLDVVIPLSRRPMIVLYSLSFYVNKLFVPLSLGPYYPLNVHELPPDGAIRWAWLAPLAAALALGIAATAMSRALSGRFRREAWVCAGLFVAGMFPMLNILPAEFQKIAFVADRYMYVSMFGPALMLSAIMARAWRAEWIQAVALILLVLALLSFRQAGVWRDDDSLHRYAYERQRGNKFSCNGLGYAETMKGHFSEAERYFRDALAIDPDWYHGERSLATALELQGRRDEALPHFQRAVEIKPKYWSGRIDLGKALVERGRYDEALVHFRFILDHHPEIPLAHELVSDALRRKGSFADAERAAREGIAVAGDSPRLRFRLGLALAARQKTEEAIAEIQKAAEQAPEWPEPAQVLAKLRAIRPSQEKKTSPAPPASVPPNP